MDIYVHVVARLSALGYTATDADKEAIRYNIHKAEATLKNKTNRQTVPDELFYSWIDMATGLFLTDKKATGALADVYNFSAAPTSISEGDTSVSFAAGDSAEKQFDALLAKLLAPDDELILSYRRLAW